MFPCVRPQFFGQYSGMCSTVSSCLHQMQLGLVLCVWWSVCFLGRCVLLSTCGSQQFHPACWIGRSPLLLPVRGMSWHLGSLHMCLMFCCLLCLLTLFRAPCSSPRCSFLHLSCTFPGACWLERPSAGFHLLLFGALCSRLSSCDSCWPLEVKCSLLTMSFIGRTILTN